MIEIRYVQTGDKAFWFRLDRHLPEPEFENKVKLKRGYVLTDNNIPAGILRYNLFWDNTPFCTLIFMDDAYRRKGLGKMLMERWERDMKDKGCKLVLVSTQADEDAQHFYRKLGYRDCGGLVLDSQPMELFLAKEI